MSRTLRRVLRLQPVPCLHVQGAGRDISYSFETGSKSCATRRLNTQPTRYWHAVGQAVPVRPSQLLQAARARVLEAVHALGGTDVRVFGSVARGTDQPGSDVDLLVTFPPDADIVTLLTLEEELSDLLFVPVHMISASGSGPLLERAIAEAIPLSDLKSDHLSQ